MGEITELPRVDIVLIVKWPGTTKELRAEFDLPEVMLTNYEGLYAMLGSMAAGAIVRALTEKLSESA